MRLIPAVCIWFCLSIFRKKGSSRGIHDFILNLIAFYNLFFEALELFSGCSRKWKVIWQNPVEAESAGAENPTELWRAGRCSDQNSQSQIKNISRKQQSSGLPFSSLPTEPLVGTYVRLDPHPHQDFICNTVVHKQEWVANIDYGAFCKFKILKYCIMLLCPPYSPLKNI